MIYTVTFNPALDYVVKVRDFMLGTVNRTYREDIYCGGKGLNVSAVLANLGYESTALGFIAGFTGEEIERGARTLGFHTDFIRVEKGLSRINIKLKSREESEINGLGPEIEAGDVDKLFGQLDRLRDGDTLILSGSIPACLSEDMYQRIMARLDGRGIMVLVDATRELLVNVLQYHPFLIKPNNHELGEIFGRELNTDEEITAHARLLQQKGARNVLISMAGDGAILVTESGDVWKMGVPKGTVKNSVGAGDSMVAGFVAGYLENGDYEHALRLGSACGSASAFSEGLGTKDTIEEMYRQLQ